MPNSKELARLPDPMSLGDTPPPERTLQMRFSFGTRDWYVVAYDRGKHMLYGYLIGHDNLRRAQWKHFPLNDLINSHSQSTPIERDLYWEPKKLGDVCR